MGRLSHEKITREIKKDIKLKLSRAFFAKEHFSFDVTCTNIGSASVTDLFNNISDIDRTAQWQSDQGNDTLLDWGWNIFAGGLIEASFLVRF